MKNKNLSNTLTVVQTHAFVRLISSHSDLIWYMIRLHRSVTEGREQEFYQEILIFCWNRFHLYREQGSFSGWLSLQAKWAIFQLLRSEKRYSKRFLIADNLTSYEAINEEYNEDHLVSLRNAIEDLPEYLKEYGQNLLADGPVNWTSKHHLVYKYIRDNKNRYFQDIKIHRLPMSRPLRDLSTYTAGKAICKLSMTGEIVAKYRSFNEAKKDGYNYQRIMEVINGAQPMYGGFRWKFYDN